MLAQKTSSGSYVNGRARRDPFGLSDRGSEYGHRPGRYLAELGVCHPVPTTQPATSHSPFDNIPGRVILQLATYLGSSAPQPRTSRRERLVSEINVTMMRYDGVRKTFSF